MSDIIVRHAAYQRLALWYDWQLTADAKAHLLLHFKSLILQTYAQSQVPGIHLYLPHIAPADISYTRTVIFDRLLLLFFYIQEHRPHKKKLNYESSTEKINVRINTFITELHTTLGQSLCSSP